MIDQCPTCGNPVQVTPILPAAELDRLRAALKTIRNRYGVVCDNFELCRHAACQSSYSAWQMAAAALAPEGSASIAGSLPVMTRPAEMAERDMLAEALHEERDCCEPLRRRDSFDANQMRDEGNHASQADSILRRLAARGYTLSKSAPDRYRTLVTSIATEGAATPGRSISKKRLLVMIDAVDALPAATPPAEPREALPDRRIKARRVNLEYDDGHHPSCCGACDECFGVCGGYHGPERRAAALSPDRPTPP